MVEKFRDKNGELTVKVGDRIAWDTLNGAHFEGVIVEIDSNVGIVELDGGGTRAVEL